MIYLRGFILGCLLLILAGTDLVSENEDGSSAIQIEAKPIHSFKPDEPNRRTFGLLEFKGGLVLSCSNPHFGGISALSIQRDGKRFLALSDRAYWIGGQIVYEQDLPKAITDAKIAPVRGPDGKHTSGWDTESIAQRADCLYMGVEGLDRILKFLYDGVQFPYYQNAVPFPAGVKDLPKNGGLEALAFFSENNRNTDVLLAFSEEGLDAKGNHRSYWIENEESKDFSVKRTDNYAISDAAELPDGDVLILERKYDLKNGVSVRLRRLSAHDIQPGALVDGKVVMEVDMHCEVDNMEAISLHRAPNGKNILTLVSDDNFSHLQRTLLLQFEMNDVLTTD
ncbi:MAG: esterase-like activity of phytase family protein [Acidobacteriota bacterium]